MGVYSQSSWQHHHQEQQHTDCLQGRRLLVFQSSITSQLLPPPWLCPGPRDQCSYSSCSTLSVLSRPSQLDNARFFSLTLKTLRTMSTTSLTPSGGESVSRGSTSALPYPTAK